MTAPSEGAGPVILAGGGAVWRPTDGGLETAVIHRPKYDDWSLPKGKLDDGEHVLAAAVREVAEETGITGMVGRRSVSTRYPVVDGVKHVDYWLMRAVGGAAFEPNREVDELRWLPLDEASALLSHDHDRSVLDDLARTDIPREPTLLLVRHGRAGSKDDWAGPDDLRPLDDKGRAQALRLAEVLPLFAPTAVLSVPRTRCTQTVEPLAERLGLPVLPCPALGEEEFQEDPEAGLGVVEQLLEPRAVPGVTVVCSQGGAIPSVLMALGVTAGGDRAYPPSAKGSTWALGGTPGRLAADYYRDFAGSAVGFQDGRDAS